MVFIPIYVHFSLIFQKPVSQAEVVSGKKNADIEEHCQKKPCTINVILLVTAPPVM